MWQIGEEIYHVTYRIWMCPTWCAESPGFSTGCVWLNSYYCISKIYTILYSLKLQPRQEIHIASFHQTHSVLSLLFSLHPSSLQNTWKFPHPTNTQASLVPALPSSPTQPSCKEQNRIESHIIIIRTFSIRADATCKTYSFKTCSFKTWIRCICDQSSRSEEFTE